VKWTGATLLVAFGFALVGCDEPSPQGAARDAAAGVPAVIPLIQFENKLYVPARVNGVDVGYMLVDTGSSQTDIRPAFATKLGLPFIGKKNLSMLEGTKLHDLVLAKELEIGPLHRRDLPVFVCDCGPETLRRGEAIVGAVGMNVLGAQPFEINFRELTLTLNLREKWTPPSDAGFALEPDADTPHVRGAIGGREGWFQIDTGSSDTSLLTKYFIDQNRDLIYRRPLIKQNLVWSGPDKTYNVRWDGFDVLGIHAEPEFGSIDISGAFGARVAGLIGAPRFRESVLTIDMQSRRAWCKRLDAEPLDDLVKRLAAGTPRDQTAPSPLYLAATLRRLDAVERLLELGEKADRSDYMNLTPLMWASGRGSNDIVSVLLRHGAKPEARCDYDGYAALLFAARHGRMATVITLLENGANVNVATDSGRTPLFLVAEAGFKDLVVTLVEHGAEVDKALPTGETPLLAACSQGNEEVVEYLIAHGANVSAKGPRGTCLSYAASGGSARCVKALLAKGADPNATASNGPTALFEAASLGTSESAEIVRLLLAAGADPSVKSNTGKIALDLALNHGDVEAVKLLYEATRGKGNE